MNERARLKRSIYEMDFVLYELVLFLDSHPTNRKALELMREYRIRRNELVAEYERRFGKYIVTTGDVPVEQIESWQWLQGPWPWETDFMEG